MRNVITIPSALHQDFRAFVIVNCPDLNLGEAAAQAVALWMKTKKESCKQSRSRKASVTSR